MKKTLFFSLFIFCSFLSIAEEYYWIGGSGNWDNTARWSLTSGGTTAGALPTAADTVYFNALSGPAGFTVTMNVPVTVTGFDFTAAPDFTLAGALASIEIRGFLRANSTANVSYTGAIHMFASSVSGSIQSNGRAWGNNFVFTGSTGTNGVTLADALNTTGNISITRGVFNSATFQVQCSNFSSTAVGARNINLNNSTINLSGTSWLVEPGTGPNPLTWSAAGSTVNLDNTGNVSFVGGALTYGALNSDAAQLTIERSNIFGATVLLNSSDLRLENNVTQTFSSLTLNGTCLSNATIAPINANQPAATINITTSPFNGTYINVTKVNAAGPTVYNLSGSTVVNSTGWTQISSKFYWINNGGDWSDGSHWSNTSGGAAAGCVPSGSDSVFFDINSFTLSNQTVRVDTIGYFKAMKWTDIPAGQTLLLDSLNANSTGDLFAFGDMTLHPNVNVRRVELSPAFEFRNSGVIRANGANIDANFRINMPTTALTVLLGTDLIMSDTSSVILLQGGLNTQNNSFKTGTFSTLNDPAGPGDTRSLTLGSSAVHIVRIFQSENDAQFTLNAGTSNVYIGDTVQIIPDTLSFLNGLMTSGSTFYNVTLNFQKVKFGPTFLDQKVTGNNTFNQLKIIPGSRVQFENGSTQIVNDTLFIIGSCADSIYILSDGAGQFNITKTDTKVKAQCVRMEDCNISSAQTAYFSTNVGNNSANWTFNTQSPVGASFTSSTPDCFGDVTTFTPSSSTLFSEPVAYFWQFNDGSTAPITSDQYSAYSDAVLNYISPVGINVSDTIPISSWTELTDPSNLFFPAIGTGTAYPSPNATSANFVFDAKFTLSLENGTGASAFLVDMDNSVFPIKYKYRPKIIVYKNGVPNSSVFLTTNSIDFAEGTLSNGSTILADTTVSVSLSVVNLQPTDQITFESAVVVTFDAFPTRPRWKSGNTVGSPDVTVNYKMVYDSVHFTAIPLSNNLTGNSHVFNDRGNFNVSLIATNTVNGCTDTVTNVVNIFGPISYLSTSQLDTTICIGEEVTFTGTSSGDTNTLYSFLINGNVVQTPSLSNTFVIDTLTNLDIVSIQTSNGGCTSVNDPYFQFVVNQLPTFGLSITPNDTICTGQSITFDASPDNSGVQYRYRKNSSFVTSYNLTGVYTSSTLVNNDTITLLARSIATGCIADSVIPITVNPLPTVTLNESTTDFIICQGESVNFTAFGATQYEFFISGVSQGVQASNTFTTTALANGNTVSVRGISSSGCQNFSPTTFTYTVTTTPVVNLNINPGTTVCTGTNVNVVASGANLYQFFVNNVSQGAASSTNFISSSSYANGTEFYVVGSSNGCTDTSNVSILTVNIAPTTNLLSSDADNSICAGTPVTFTGIGATNYQFFVNGVSQGPSSPTSTFVTSSLSNGNVVSVTGVSNGCFVSQQITMTVLNNPNVQLFSSDADNIVCQGTSVTFTGTSGVQYVFNVNSVNQASQASPTITPTLNIGSNSVFVVGTAANGCSTQSPTITTLVNPNPTMSLISSDADNIICAGQPVTFTASGSTSYQFFVSGVAQGSMSGTNTFTSSTLLNGQVVTVTGSSLGCTSSSTGITMTVNPLPPVSLTSSDANNIFCVGDAVTFSAFGATSYEFFVNGVSQGAPSAVSTLNASGFIPGTYPVSVTGNTAGCSASATFNVTVNSLPSPILTSSDADNVICAGQSVTYTATGGNLYEFFVNGLSQGALGPLGTFSSALLTNGNVVSVNVISIQGCNATAVSPALTVNPIPAVTLNSSDADGQICVGENVMFTSSGANTYEFFVNGVSQGTPSATNTFSTTGLLNGQVITVSGTSSGCSFNPPALTFNVFGPPAVQLFNNATLEVCNGQGIDLTANGAANYQFLVNGIPAGPFSSNPNFTGTVNNGDVVTVTGESNGCTNASATSYTYTVFNYPTLISNSSEPSLTICIDDPVTITSSGATTYLFEINGTSVQNGVTNTYTTSDLENGDVIEVTGFNGNCASTPSVFSFTVNQMDLSLLATPGSMICEGESVTFTGTGANQYEFFVNGVSQGPLSSNTTFSSATLADGDQVSLTGFSTATGCLQVEANYILMDVMATPALNADGGPDFCEGDSIILTSNFTTGNQWFLNGTAIPGATDTMLVVYDSGDYSLGVIQGGNGDLWSFGLNAQGIFADGSNLNSTEPVSAQGGIQFDAISSGQGFMLGLTPAGTVYAWGENSSGQLGNGTFTSSNVPLSLPALSGITAIATTYTSSMAVTGGGNVYVWGNNSVGQLATGNTSVINFPFLNAALTNVDSVAAGRSHVVILKNDGTVWTSGSNDFGQLGNGTLNGSLSAIQVPGLSGITRIGAGEYSSFAMNSSGDLYVWGNNSSGQLGLGDLVNRLNPTISGLRNIVHAEGGAAHSVFLASDQDLFASGSNIHGQLGNGTTNNSTTPVRVEVEGAKMVSAGEYNTLILRDDRSVFACGSNIENQISSSTDLGYSLPTHINSVHGVAYVEASTTASHFIYDQEQTCTSGSITLNELPVPIVTISENSGVLSTISGVSYQWYFNGLPVVESTGTLATFTPLTPGYYSVEVTFANGCSGISNEFPFGVSELVELDKSMKLYPNPTQGDLFIELHGYEGETTEVFVVDVMGRKVKVLLDSFSEVYQINLSDLEAGTYMIEIFVDQLHIGSKAIIKGF
jgi:alpha-tubulin suppressor-like RCC1 family protein